MASLVENSLRRVRELVEQRRILEAQVWIAGIIAIVERCRRDHLAAKDRQEKRITNLVTNLGNDAPQKVLAFYSPVRQHFSPMSPANFSML